MIDRFGWDGNTSTFEESVRKIVRDEYYNIVRENNLKDIDNELHNSRLRIVEESEKESPEETSHYGTTWKASLPCPDCGHNAVIGYLLVDEHDNHMHTKYLCTFWPANPEGRILSQSITKPCGWTGYSIPGWGKED